jgi:hypothetical protein
MLWYRSWLETKWRFLIGLILLMCSAGGVVLIYPSALKLIPLGSNVAGDDRLARIVKESGELARTYRGYIWSQWFRQTQLGIIFAILLGTGSLLQQGTKGAALFTLSLPVSRRRLVGVRAATGLAEFLVMALVPSLFVPLMSPAIGQRYSISSALIHGICIFLAGSVFFSLAFLLSTVFTDSFRPILITFAVVFAWTFFDQVFSDFSRYSIFAVMNAEVYFRNGQLPWLGLLATTAASGAMLYLASVNTARQDF